MPPFQRRPTRSPDACWIFNRSGGRCLARHHLLLALFTLAVRGSGQAAYTPRALWPRATAAETRAGCLAFSAIGDGLNGFGVSLENHDVAMTAVSRAPLDKLQACKRRMGLELPVGILARQRSKLRPQRLVHRGGTARRTGRTTAPSATRPEKCATPSARVRPHSSTCATRSRGGCRRPFRGSAHTRARPHPTPRWPVDTVTGRSGSPVCHRPPVHPSTTDRLRMRDGVSAGSAMPAP